MNLEGKTEEQELVWIRHSERRCSRELAGAQPRACYWKGIIERPSGFELRQSCLQSQSKDSNAFLFLIFLQTVLQLVIPAWRLKGQRFKRVHLYISLKWSFSLHCYQKEKRVGCSLCSCFGSPLLHYSITDKALPFNLEISCNVPKALGLQSLARLMLLLC